MMKGLIKGQQATVFMRFLLIQPYSLISVAMSTLFQLSVCAVMMIFAPPRH